MRYCHLGRQYNLTPVFRTQSQVFGEDVIPMHGRDELQELAEADDDVVHIEPLDVNTPLIDAVQPAGVYIGPAIDTEVQENTYDPMRELLRQK